MNIGRTSIVVSAVLAASLGFPATGRTDERQKTKAVNNAVVEFGQPQPQPVAAPGTPLAATTHFLDPDDVTIRKGGTVTFVVNGGGHGIAIHEVSRKTTREDIAADLCQGPPGSTEDDRFTRASVSCNGTTGTANRNYDITDGKGDLVIRTGTNPPNPRVDDPRHSHRLLSTSGRYPGVEDGTDTPPASGNPAGAFLVGTAPNAAAPPAFLPGNRIRVTFDKTGRFLVICQNRGHSLNDHMFGFVSVVGDGKDEDDDDEDNSGPN